MAFEVKTYLNWTMSDLILPLFAWRRWCCFCTSNPGPSRQMPQLLDVAWPSVWSIRAHVNTAWQSGGGIQTPPIPSLQTANFPTWPPSPWAVGCRNLQCSLETLKESCCCTDSENIWMARGSPVFHIAYRDGNVSLWNQPACRGWSNWPI